MLITIESQNEENIIKVIKTIRDICTIEDRISADGKTILYITERSFSP